MAGIVGRYYWEKGALIEVVIQWGLKSRGETHGGPRNVMIERYDGELVVRPFRGLRVAYKYDRGNWIPWQRPPDFDAPDREAWDAGRMRPCGTCGLALVLPEGAEPDAWWRAHDPCIANLPGVSFACCGHGVADRERLFRAVHRPVVSRAAPGSFTLPGPRERRRPMEGIVARLIRLNAQFLVRALRATAQEIELLEPGSPAIAFPLIFYVKEVPYMGQITVKDSDGPFRASVAFVDAKGSPTEPDDVPQWAVDDESVASVAVDDDGKGAEFTPGSPGAAEAATTQVTVTSTDTDGSVVTAVGTITVTSGEAVLGDVSFAAPAPVEPPV